MPDEFATWEEMTIGDMLAKAELICRGGGDSAEIFERLAVLAGREEINECPTR